MYCEAFPRDRLGIKTLVWLMFVLETGFSILINIAAWNVFGSGWGDPETLGELDWTWLVMLPLNAICHGRHGAKLLLVAYMELDESSAVASYINWLFMVAFYSGMTIVIGGRSVPHLFALWPEITVGLAQRERYMQSPHNSVIGLHMSLPWLNAPCGSAVENGISTKFSFSSWADCASPTAITVPQSSFWAELDIERGQSMNFNLIPRTGVNGSHTTDGTAAHDNIVMSDFQSNTDVTVVGSGVAISEK
ncbi:hypothetical protein B0H17DRAFT_1129832 [Mycena rosella]|uniref:Uncharacterized protein n=1 Tax=Mycena rosella TaxID=1033263 RepID=A0AAD7DRW3_MYCRO|nr:hypothetical protein B0H17DRAFT_1129832 [Mycena rosella]